MNEKEVYVVFFWGAGRKSHLHNVSSQFLNGVKA